MNKNYAIELLKIFDKLEEDIVLYKKIERTYDMPVILDTNIREDINNIYTITLKAVGALLEKQSIEYNKYDINEMLHMGRDSEILTEKMYKLILSNFLQFNDINLHQQHSVNYLIDWYLNNDDEVKEFRRYIYKNWLPWFE